MLTSPLQDTVAVGRAPKHTGSCPQYKSDWNVPDVTSPAVLPFHTDKMKPVSSDYAALPPTIKYVGEATHLKKLRPAEPLVEHERHLRHRPDDHIPIPPKATSSVEELLKELVSKLR